MTTASLSSQPATTATVHAPTTVAIHQPNYFGWLGFFHKVASCDLFVVLDDVQFVRRGFIHRNRIKTSQGVSWLTIPTRNKGHYHACINEIMPDHGQGWVEKHQRSVQHAYGRCAYHDDVQDNVIDPVLALASRSGTSLADVGFATIQHVCRYLGINTPMVKASSMNIASSSTQRLIDIVRHVGGQRYLSGKGARKYMSEEMFAVCGIDLQYAHVEMPHYRQPHGEFMPGLSILDALCCCGPSTREMLQSAG